MGKTYTNVRRHLVPGTRKTFNCAIAMGKARRELPVLLRDVMYALPVCSTSGVHVTDAMWILQVGSI